MPNFQIQRAYGARAEQYTSALGSIEHTHEPDRAQIKQWALQIHGKVIDAGCGPGHWAHFLHGLGSDVEGVDLVPEFVDSARIRFPEVPFRVGSLLALDLPDQSVQGVLAWYSLIHLPPQDVPLALKEFARVLPPNGHLLIGFFEGDPGEIFDHKVTAAYYWSIKAMTQFLWDAGFDVSDSVTRQVPGSRPHAAISAVLTDR